MSLWTQVKPLIAHLPVKESLGVIIDSKDYGRFSKKNQGVTGYYRENYILVVEGLFKPNKQQHPKKSIFKATVLKTDEKPIRVFPAIFKKIKRVQDSLQKVIETYVIHQQMFEKYPDAVAPAPIVLGKICKNRIVKEKLVDASRLEIVEQVFPSTLSRNHLIKRKISIAQTFSGFEKIAVVLEELHSRGLIHRDIKNFNMFVTQQKLLMLFDFDLLDTFDELHQQQNKYEYWDLMSCYYGLTHPFCDVYGWTVTFAIAVYGKEFFQLHQSSRDKSDYLLQIDKLAQENKAKLPQDVSEVIFKFVCRIFIANVSAYAKTAAFYNKLCKERKISRPELTRLLREQTRDLPTIKDCIAFIRPLESRLSQAK